MTNTPIKPKRVTKEFLESHFDHNGWEARLDAMTPHELDYGPTPETLGHPKGTVTFVYVFKDANTDIAMVSTLRTTKGEYRGGRKYHPIALLIEGEWCYY